MVCYAWSFRAVKTTRTRALYPQLARLYNGSFPAKSSTWRPTSSSLWTPMITASDRSWPSSAPGHATPLTEVASRSPPITVGLLHRSTDSTRNTIPATSTLTPTWTKNRELTSTWQQIRPITTSTYPRCNEAITSRVIRGQLPPSRGTTMPEPIST